MCTGYKQEQAHWPCTRACVLVITLRGIAKIHVIDDENVQTKEL